MTISWGILYSINILSHEKDSFWWFRNFEFVCPKSSKHNQTNAMNFRFSPTMSGLDIFNAIGFTVERFFYEFWFQKWVSKSIRFSRSEIFSEKFFRRRMIANFSISGRNFHAKAKHDLLISQRRFLKLIDKKYVSDRSTHDDKNWLILLYYRLTYNRVTWSNEECLWIKNSREYSYDNRIFNN